MKELDLYRKTCRGEDKFYSSLTDYLDEVSNGRDHHIYIPISIFGRKVLNEDTLYIRVHESIVGVIYLDYYHKIVKIEMYENLMIARYPDNINKTINEKFAGLHIDIEKADQIMMMEL